MSNRIPRDATRLDVTFLVNHGANCSHMIAEKTEGGWTGTDDNGKRWHLFPSHLRNGDLCKIAVLA